MSFKFLSKDYPIEKSFLIITRFCLRWMGLYPKIHLSIFELCNFFFHFLILFSSVITQFWYGFYYLKIDLFKGIDAMCPAAPCMVTCVKSALIFWKRKELIIVLNQLKRILLSEKNEENKKIIRQLSATATNLSFMLLFVSMSASIIYSLRPLVTNAIRVSMGKEYLFDETTIKVFVPSASLRLPWYPLTYSLISYMGHVTVLTFSGINGLFLYFCLYIAALLKILQKDIKFTLKCYDNTYQVSAKDVQIITENLKEVVRQHIVIMDLVKKLSNVFKWITLLHFVTSAIVIGASIIEGLLFWYGFYYLKIDLFEGIDAMCPAAPCMVTCVKSALIFWKRKELIIVLNQLKRILLSEKNEENKKIIRQLSATATNLSFILLIVGMSCSIIYSLRPLVTNAIRVSMGKEYLFDETTLKVFVPTASLRLPWYPLTYSLISYMGHVTVLTFSGINGLFLYFCLYIAALLKILQKDIKFTLKGYDNNKLSAKDVQIITENLKEVVRQHIVIMDLVKKFSHVFKWITLLHFVTSAIVIGASIIEGLLFPAIRALICALFTLSALCELFIFCYGGTIMLEESFKLGSSAYCSNWYKCDLKVKKMILMIIIRSQKPLTMDIPFFSPSLMTFSLIIQRAGSFIAVVKSVL